MRLQFHCKVSANSLKYHSRTKSLLQKDALEWIDDISTVQIDKIYNNWQN